MNILNIKTLVDNKSIILAKLYKKIIFFEWFAVAGLTAWLLMVFMTILH